MSNIVLKALKTYYVKDIFIVAHYYLLWVLCVSRRHNGDKIREASSYRITVRVLECFLKIETEMYFSNNAYCFLTLILLCGRQRLVSVLNLK